MGLRINTDGKEDSRQHGYETKVATLIIISAFRGARKQSEEIRKEWRPILFHLEGYLSKRSPSRGTEVLCIGPYMLEFNRVGSNKDVHATATMPALLVTLCRSI